MKLRHIIVILSATGLGACSWPSLPSISFAKKPTDERPAISLDAATRLNLQALDWANAMILLNYDNLEPDIIAQTLGALVKNADDLERFRTEAIEHIMQSVG